jgi:hypothetical protein
MSLVSAHSLGDSTHMVCGDLPSGTFMAMFCGHGSMDALHFVRTLSTHELASFASDPINLIHARMLDVNTFGSGLAVLYVILPPRNSDGVVIVHKCGNIKCRVHFGDRLVYESVTVSTQIDFDGLETMFDTVEYTPSLTLVQTGDLPTSIVEVPVLVGTYAMDGVVHIVPSHEFLGHNECGGRPLSTTECIPYSFPELISVVITNFETECLMGHPSVKALLHVSAESLVCVCDRLSTAYRLGESNYASMIYQTQHALWKYASLCIPRVPFRETPAEVHAALENIFGVPILRVEAYKFQHGDTSMFIHFNPSIPSQTNGRLHYIMTKLHDTPFVKLKFADKYWLIAKNKSADNLRIVQTAMVDPCPEWDGVSDIEGVFS